jgi:hypothetical protein
VDLVRQIHVGENFDEKMEIVLIVVNQYDWSLFVHPRVYYKYMSNSGAERFSGT